MYTQFSVTSRCLGCIWLADDIASSRRLRKRAMVKPFQPKLVWSYKVHWTWGFFWHHPTDLVSSCNIMYYHGLSLFLGAANIQNNQIASRGSEINEKHMDLSPFTGPNGQRICFFLRRSILPGEGRPGWFRGFLLVVGFRVWTCFELDSTWDDWEDDPGLIGFCFGGCGGSKLIATVSQIEIRRDQGRVLRTSSNFSQHSAAAMHDMLCTHSSLDEFLIHDQRLVVSIMAIWVKLKKELRSFPSKYHWSSLTRLVDGLKGFHLYICILHIT